MGGIIAFEWICWGFEKKSETMAGNNQWNFRLNKGHQMVKDMES